MEEKCKFCGSEEIEIVHEHYTFCKDCTVLYTDMFVIKKSCNHFSDSATVVEREPWYKEARGKFAYVQDDQCSVCGKEVIADGW